MMRVLPIFLLVLAIPFSIAQGQDNKARSGTPYSSIAFGEPFDNLSPGTMGMGLSGVSLHHPYAANSVNPALWGMSPYTQGVVSLDLQNFNATDGMGAAGYRHFGINQFQVVLPLVRSRLGTSFGFFPVTRSSFDLSTSGSIVPDGEPVEFLNTTEGSGGISKMEAGLGYRLNENLTIGYAASVHFATIHREISTLFDSPDFSTLEYSDRISGHTLGHRFGLYGRRSSLFGSRDAISLGATVSLPVNLSTERSFTSFRDVGGRMSAVNLLPGSGVGAGEIEIPLEFNLGLTYTPSRLLDLSAEFQRQHWGEARYSHDRSQEQYLVDRSRMGAGFQFHPYVREGEPGFFSRFRYSAGVTYDTGHLLIENQNIETLMFHAGLGILAGRQASSIDIGFHLGFRGTEAQNLVQETIWGFKLSVNLAEWMFQRTRFQ